MRVLYVADPAVWRPDLGDRIRTEVDSGRIVVVRTVSGAALTIANVVDGDTVETFGVRHNPHDPFGTDGLPLLLGRIDGTSCGVWSASGYTSSRPVTVHVLDHPHEGGDSAAWMETLRELADYEGGPHAWLDRVPDGHPAEPCPVNHCVLRAPYPTVPRGGEADEASQRPADGAPRT